MGSRGDSYDNALAETINGLYKAELIHRRAPWKTKEAVELATLEWVHWFKHIRLLEPIGYIPPAEAEAEANYYRQLAEKTKNTGKLKPTGLLETRGDSIERPRPHRPGRAGVWVPPVRSAVPISKPVENASYFQRDFMQNALLLGSAIFFELIATASLKASDGFTRLLPSSLTVLGYAASFYLLSLTLKRMEVSVVYAIWSGAGTALMAVVGYCVFAEQLPPLKVASIGLIVLGVVGLNLAGKSA